MREYGKVYSSFWTSETTRDLSDTGRILALYLLSCSHSTICGAFRLPDGYVSEDLNWGSERVAEGFEELFRKGFVNRCESTKWAFICQHFEWNKPENPNQWKAARKMALQIPGNCVWLVDFVEVFNELIPDKVEPLANPSERVTQTLSKPETETETETETEQPPHTKGKSENLGSFVPDHDWQPDQQLWEATAFRAGLTNPDYSNHLTEFICHYASHAAQQESFWIGKLISWIKRSGQQTTSSPAPGGEPHAANQSQRASSTSRKPSLVERVEQNVKQRQQARASRTGGDPDGKTLDEDGEFVRV